MLLYYLRQCFTLKLNFKLKIDPKTFTFESLEEIFKTRKKFPD